MAVIHVYAVLAGDAAVPPLAGIDDAAVAARHGEELVLAVSEHAAPPEVSERNVLRHAEVVEALAADGAAVLPVRFGLAFTTEESLLRDVQARAPELRASVERVRGCTEIGLRVLCPESAEPAPRSSGGAAYMRSRLRETVERTRLAAEVHERLARHARDSARSASAAERLLVDAAYLVPRDDVASFREEVARLGRSRPELSFLCTGPWPPYSFAASAEERR